ncbi:HAD family hydrolase [Streptomyces alkaliterrae]|uniref:HAD hydrolase-like protein n=1 Tax=Streptomyces alkaliterrae TaxID=2213162 RepID=A0A5P0YS07_9ACTN|nr:HAD hydrolase-like protein [Streptomyces alkaliterrae]MBB1255083.1 HAD hydrolase-like protein [Streptomyces alkaliterrae]MBB1261586.1 HAD hydrolase-like protein [Streptomyces alkaliterrae]MQS03111.1 HAD hydrolase-like protein [Streptomyces alkaliterrae]
MADMCAAALPTTVGFDLDMTLIDSRPGIRATYEALAVETGVAIDAELAVSRLGPPLEHELAHWFARERIPEMVVRYRALYEVHAFRPTLPMPGAVAALAALHEAGGRSLVVTAKNEPHARMHLEHLGMRADAVAGSLWAEAKAEALRAHGATALVGDHVGDVRGARAAGVTAVAVATGPCDEAELRAAGADVVLPDLHAFGAWLSEAAHDAPPVAPQATAG